MKKNRFSWTDWERILGFYSQEWHRVSFRKNWILDLKNNMFQDEILWERTAFTKWLPMFMGLSLIRIEPCIARSRQLTTRLLLGWNKVYECRVYRIFADFTCRMKISFQCGCGVLSCIVFIVTQDPKFCTKPDQPGNALKLYLFSILPMVWETVTKCKKHYGHPWSRIQFYSSSIITSVNYTKWKVRFLYF